MPSDTIENLIKMDFDALSDQFEKDHFANRVLFKLGARRRARLGVVCFAGGLGAAFAASQFMDVVKTLAPSIANSTLAQSVPAIAAGQAPQMLTMLMLAGALAVTALVLRQEA